MRLYLIWRTDSNDYDEYSEVLIAAKNEADALALATSVEEGGYGSWWAKYNGFRRDGSNLKIREIAARTTEPAGEVLSSFHAG